MNRAIFFDLDGTIIKDYHYNVDPSRITFVSGALRTLKLLQDTGYLLIIVTNQSGIARGMYTLEEMKKYHNHILEILEREGIHISKIYYCPHLKDGVVKEYAIDCNCRKPKTGLFLKAVEEFDIDVSKSYVVGNEDRDLCFASIDGCQGLLLSDKPTTSPNSINIKRFSEIYSVVKL